MALAATVTPISAENDVAYNIVGANAPTDGAVVRLFDQLSKSAIDSAVVSGGRFQMKGKASKDAFLSVGLHDCKWWFWLFNDGEPVCLNYADSTIIGSALNMKLTECDKRNFVAFNEYYSVIEAYTSLPEDEMKAREAEFAPKCQAAFSKYGDFYVALIEENADNLIPVAFIDKVPSVAGEAKFEELMASGKPFARHPYALDFKRKVDESKQEWEDAVAHNQDIVGKKFIDLEEPDADGNMHKLSEFVGRGKWVLIDFWASWCGSCRMDMPYVVDAYYKYHDRGFDIVGLSFDMNKDAWLKAIREWDMPWTHLSDLKQWKTAANEVYNVLGIPDNLLVAPDGTIVARGLVHGELEAKLAEIFK